MSDDTVVVVLREFDEPQDQWTDADRQHWRMRRAHKARLDTPSKAQADWAVRELLFHCTCTNPRNAYHVTLRMPLGLDHVAVSPVPGERVVRLLYQWSDIEPHLHLPPVQLRDQVLAAMCTEGNILRAGLAYAAARGGR